MAGWKTWLAAIGMIATGVGLVIGGFLADPQNWEMVQNGITMILAGLALIGIGHKIEKKS